MVAVPQTGVRARVLSERRGLQSPMDVLPDAEFLGLWYDRDGAFLSAPAEHSAAGPQREILFVHWQVVHQDVYVI